jgi:CheY-like chemotaxis protein
LIVDDQQNIADSLALILQKRGHIVRAAYSGEDAVLIAQSFQPHAVVSDVMMYGMSGVELAICSGTLPQVQGTPDVRQCGRLPHSRRVHPRWTRAHHPGQTLPTAINLRLPRHLHR